jgi:hypothetical protein
MPGTTTRWPRSPLPTTNVLAAMSPTRRWPLVVSPVMNPTNPGRQ